MGAPVRFRSGLRRRPAILAELSTRGCRMMVDSGCHRAAPDRLVTVVLPPEITDDKRSLSLRGHVMRVSSAEAGSEVIAVLFELLKESVRKRLESIVSTHSHGPAVLDEAIALALDSLPIISEGTESQTMLPKAGGPHSPDLGESADGMPGERRVQGRHAISRRIIALGDEAARVLIGRDISVGGMRIDSTPGLAMGDHLKVAVHVRPDGQPLVVSAEIVRDDGPEGMALQFYDLSPAVHAHLKEMVSALPSIIESNGSKDGAGVVVTEVVGRRAS